MKIDELRDMTRTPWATSYKGSQFVRTKGRGKKGEDTCDCAVSRKVFYFLFFFFSFFCFSSWPPHSGRVLFFCLLACLLVGLLVCLFCFIFFMAVVEIDRPLFLDLCFPNGSDR